VFRASSSLPKVREGILTVLITGGCGFIGRSLVRDLLGEGAKTVFVVDDLSTGRHPDDWLPESDVERIGARSWVYTAPTGSSVHFVLSDLREILSETQDSEFSGMLFDEVYHLAARVGGRLALENRPFLIADNFSIDASFFSWVHRAGESVRRVLYMSSSAVYPLSLQGHSGNTALREPLADMLSTNDTDGVYGWAKLTGEYLARTVAALTGVRVACVRPFSGYGPDQDLVYPVPAIAQRASARKDPLIIWGSGEQQRDFIYITDVIAGMRRAIGRASDGKAVNLGTGRGSTFAGIASMFAELSGYEPEIVADRTKPTGAEVRVAETSHMLSELDWQPSVELVEGMRRVLTAFERRA
jgi:nucleoside-diphosphate-sugar epimerase